jgi:hypothetical protein
MQTARRRRTTWAIAASVIAHLAVGVLLVRQHPVLVTPLGESGPPEPIIPILIMPKTPPPAGAHAPAPIRLHRRPQPFLPPEVEAAPIAPPAPAAPAPTAPTRGPVALHPSPLPEGPKTETRTALRQSLVGCANAEAVGLNRAEREHCDEVLGKGAKTTAFAGLGLSPEKQRLFDAAAARKEADYRYKHGGVPPVNPTIGEAPTAEDLGRSLGNDKPKLAVPF